MLHDDVPGNSQQRFLGRSPASPGGRGRKVRLSSISPGFLPRLSMEQLPGRNWDHPWLRHRWFGLPATSDAQLFPCGLTVTPTGLVRSLPVTAKKSRSMSNMAGLGPGSIRRPSVYRDQRPREPGLCIALVERDKARCLPVACRRSMSPRLLSTYNVDVLAYRYSLDLDITNNR